MRLADCPAVEGSLLSQQTVFRPTGCTYPAQVRPDPFNQPLGYHHPPLTTASIIGASLTCPSAVSPLTHGSACVAAEQSRACERRPACRHNTLSQIVKPMIQAGSRLLPAPVSSPLYTLASANGEQMQADRKPCSFTQTNSPPQACVARQPAACGPAQTCQKS